VKARIKWINKARPKQITPQGDWKTWLLLAGRGFGKTRTASEDIVNYAVWHPESRIGVVAATASDLEKTCFSGVSGILSVLPKECIAKYNSNDHELMLFNGAVIQGFTAEKPDRLRGPNFHRAWCDELAAWRYPESWDMLMFALRLGENPQVIVTTTPRPTAIIKELAKAKSTFITTGSTYENEQNLAPTFLDYLEEKYQGTRLGRQELHAEILSDNPGALWQRQRLDELRVKEAPNLRRIVVAIDPAATSNQDSDETGIVVAGTGADGQGYVLADLSRRGTPDEWARAAVNAFHEWKADMIIGETNNGGEMVETVIRMVDKNAPFKAVHASRGKITRAEPISALYEQGRCHHVGCFPLLEDQMCDYDAKTAKYSPDRMDALVWALSELMTEQQYDGMLQYYRELNSNQMESAKR
jgi:predicted phage terminase large subunit-like protein